jgi:hypothetical protein
MASIGYDFHSWFQYLDLWSLGFGVWSLEYGIWINGFSIWGGCWIPRPKWHFVHLAFFRDEVRELEVLYLEYVVICNSKTLKILNYPSCNFQWIFKIYNIFASRCYDNEFPAKNLYGQDVLSMIEKRWMKRKCSGLPQDNPVLYSQIQLSDVSLTRPNTIALFINRINTGVREWDAVIPDVSKLLNSWHDNFRGGKASRLY